MPAIDIGRSQAAARRLRSTAGSMRTAAGTHLTVREVSADLDGSRTLQVLHDLHSAFVLRVTDAATEYTAVADGIDLAVDNVAAATGEAGE